MRPLRDFDIFTSKWVETHQRKVTRESGGLVSQSTYVAAPIIGADGFVVAATRISGLTLHFGPLENSPVTEDLLAHTAKISRCLQQRALHNE